MKRIVPVGAIVLMAGRNLLGNKDSGPHDKASSSGGGIATLRRIN